MVLNVSPFDLTDTFECGQCFRWNKNQDGSYNGVAFGKVLNIKKEDHGFVLSDESPVWEDYFDCLTDYNEIMRSLNVDSIIKEAISSSCGIRILKQDFFETVISFIISQNNNIPRIKAIIESLCRQFGENLGDGYFSFPDAKTLACLNPSDLGFLKAGYRDSYIIDASQKIYLNQLDIDVIKNAPIDQARAEISKIKGVGPKVADCILLFGATRTEVFPTDVWMKKVLTALYGFKTLTPNEINRFVQEKFGNLAGYAQQYLFNYARINKI
ncbi:MAG: DNA-3-methyladenine glycosylase 2 family protein [Clostridia bacterium]|nr:DNA-3-methyladenine glycosylase 2 family protein [Clostridia bacterium]